LFGKVEACGNRGIRHASWENVGHKTAKKKETICLFIGGLVKCESDKKHVEFPKELYENLTDNERWAIAAHEFGHIRERHHLIKN